MNEDNRVVVSPLVDRKMVIAPVLVTVLIQTIQPGFLALVQFMDELVAKLEDEGEYTNVEVLVDQLLPSHVFSLRVGSERA